MYQDENAVVAESIRTSRTVRLMGAQFLGLIEQLEHGRVNRARARACRLNKRQPRGSRTLQAADVAALYALRPTAPELWYISPYEFTMYWEILPARVPTTVADLQNAAAWWDVDVSPAGLEKLQRAEGGKIELLPGVDYTLKRNRRRRKFAALMMFPRPKAYGTRGCSAGDRARFVPALASERKTRVLSACISDRGRCDRLVPTYTCLLAQACVAGIQAGKTRCVDGSTVQSYVKKRNTTSATFSASTACGPADAENQANSDDAVSDEELQLTAADIPECFESTAMGSGEGAQARCVSARREQIFLAACADANATWGSGDVAAAACGETLDETFVGDVERATRAARREKQSASRQTLSSTAWPESNPSLLRQPCSHKAADAERWLSDVATRCNAEQLSFLKHVVQRVACEERNVSVHGGPTGDEDEPLRWVLHGGPGAGKSYALKLLKTELFERVLGWKRGVEFEVVALQASMADALDGDTIHHALSLSVFTNEDESSLKKQAELLQRALRWRWLLLDEFSMVSTELLARLELKCRDVVRDACPGKYECNSSIARPFGGLNVILSDDLWQLEPPSGTFLGASPTAMLKAGAVRRGPTAAYGQLLVWGGPEVGVQGVTELTICERTSDVWLQELQEQLRVGKLCADMRRFLHGAATTVPGSWCRDDVACGNSACRALVGVCSPEEIAARECSVCADERRSRRCVATAPTDRRFMEEMKQAPSIFATNDVKHHVNKVRAAAFAKEHRPLILLAAQDRISATALRDTPDLRKFKKQSG